MPVVHIDTIDFCRLHILTDLDLIWGSHGQHKAIKTRLHFLALFLTGQEELLYTIEAILIEHSETSFKWALMVQGK